MGNTEYRNVREEWDYENLDAHGNPRHYYVESYFDDSDNQKAEATNKYGIFLKDGHYQVKTVRSTGYGRTVYEDTYEEDVETSYSWLYVKDLIKTLKKDEVIDVPVLSGEKKGSVVKVGYVGFPMNPGDGKDITVWGMVLDEEFQFVEVSGHRAESKYDLVIPASVKGLKIQSVGGFGSCKGIKKLVLSEGLQRILDNAFFGCNIEEVVFPKTITWLGFHCFDRCNFIRRLVIPEEIRGTGFHSSTIKQMKSKLNEIAKYEGDPCPEHVFYKGKGYLDFAMPKYIEGSYTIEDGTTIIGDEAFAQCEGLTEVIIPETVTTIGDSAFQGCPNLERVIFKEGSKLQKIGEYAFRWCDKLTSLNLPDTPYISISRGAFSVCQSLTDVHLPSGLLSLDSNLFINCGQLKQIEIPAHIKTVWHSAFQGCCNLESVSFHKDSELEEIKEKVFLDCVKLKNINLPQGLRSICLAAFKGCSQLEQIDLPLAVQYVGEEAFSGCVSLKNVTMPAVKVAPNTFQGCQSLEKVRVLPENVIPKDMQPFADTPFGKAGGNPLLLRLQRIIKR